MVQKKSLARNISISIAAQIVSLLVAVILNLIVPKYISELDYAYWQTYVLYASYVGILHFGILDGLMLRYSQYDYDQLDKAKIGSQFRFVFIVDAIIGMAVALFASIDAMGADKYVWYFVSIAIVTKNVFTYNSYLFQMTNRISKYAFHVISQKVCYGLVVLLMLFLKVQHFEVYCMADILGDVVSWIIISRNNRGLYFSSKYGLSNTLKEVKINIACGSMLLIATWSSMLLVGGAKLVVQWHWDKLIFGKVSFSFSVTSLFLTFVTAISIVLFPSLKRMNRDELPHLYSSLRGMVSPILFLALVFYYPGAVILKLWLPAYSQSVSYLGILLPVIIYTSKVSLLTNNYLKAYRKEKDMLIINLISVGLAFLGYSICAWGFNNLTALFVWVVLVIMARSVTSEVVVTKMIHIDFRKEYFIEGIMTIIFIFSAKITSLAVGFALYLAAYIVYLYFHKSFLAAIKKRLHRA